MGKAGKWLKNLLTGNSSKKEKHKENKYQKTAAATAAVATSAPISVPKEKRRWSFRRPAATTSAAAGNNKELASSSAHGFLETRVDPERHAMAVAVATAAVTDAAVSAAQAAAAVIRLTAAVPMAKSGADVKEAAAVKIQSVFRSYLARRALCALRGLVKLQALVRGRLVRKQASATLRCMQALIAVQERARIDRLRMLEEEQGRTPRQSYYRRSPQHPRFRQHFDVTDRYAEENVKILEVDNGEMRGSIPKSRSSYSATTTQSERTDYKFTSHSQNRTPIKADSHQKVSPTPSALTDISPRTYSGRLEEFSFMIGQMSPQYLSSSYVSDATTSCYAMAHHEAAEDCPLFPSYMANTESSRAKARSQSAPKQRPDTCERQTSKRRASLEGRNIPKGVRMQRSSSQVSSVANGYQYPWSIKLDKSNVSLKDSECGSTSTVLTNATCRSFAA